MRAHGESEADRIIRVVGAELGLPERKEELGLLRKSDPRKVICASVVKGLTSVRNDWLAKRLGMGHPAGMSQLVKRARRDSKTLKILKKYERTLKSKDWYQLHGFLGKPGGAVCLGAFSKIVWT